MSHVGRREGVVRSLNARGARREYCLRGKIRFIGLCFATCARLAVRGYIVAGAIGQPPSFMYPATHWARTPAAIARVP
jgi:hypothetical protein